MRKKCEEKQLEVKELKGTLRKVQRAAQCGTMMSSICGTRKLIRMQQANELQHAKAKRG